MFKVQLILSSFFFFVCVCVITVVIVFAMFQIGSETCVLHSVCCHSRLAGEAHAHQRCHGTALAQDLVGRLQRHLRSQGAIVVVVSFGNAGFFVGFLPRGVAA